MWGQWKWWECFVPGGDAVETGYWIGDHFVVVVVVGDAVDVLEVGIVFSMIKCEVEHRQLDADVVVERIEIVSIDSSVDFLILHFRDAFITFFNDFNFPALLLLFYLVAIAKGTCLDQPIFFSSFFLLTSLQLIFF